MTIDLKKAEEFHGHLGPYLVLGMKAGELAMEMLKARKYFGIEVTVRCPQLPPQRCFIDGMQLTTGATFGKANLSHVLSEQIVARVINKQNHQAIEIKLLPELEKRVSALTEQDDLEGISQELAVSTPENLFEWK